MHREQKDVPISIGRSVAIPLKRDKVVKEDLKKIHLSLPHPLPAI